MSGNERGSADGGAPRPWQNLPTWPDAAWRHALPEDDDTAAFRAAIHEAAHAAAWLYFFVVPIGLFLHGGTGAVVVAERDAVHLGKRDHAAIRLVGIAAELVAGNAAPWKAGSHDMRSVRGTRTQISPVTTTPSISVLPMPNM